MIGTTKKRNTYKGKKNSLAEKRFIAGKMPSAGKAPDYRQTAFDRRAMIISIILYLSIDAVVSALFFRTAAAFAFLLPGVFLFLAERKKSLWKAKKAQIRREFLTGIQFAAASLQAGYSIENAFGEAFVQLKRTYQENSFAVCEFGRICSLLGLNRSLESILTDLSKRCHVEDIERFTDAFCAARRSGGDLSMIIGNTVLLMQQQEETRREIESLLAGKQTEYQLMSGIPVFLLLYVNLTSPGFFDILYDSSAGMIIIGAGLGVYLIAFLLGRKILETG